MADPLANRGVGPVRGAEADPESDTVDTRSVTRGIYVGVSGDVKVDLFDGDTVTFTNLAAGVIHPIHASRIYDTGTTATGVVACY